MSQIETVYVSIDNPWGEPHGTRPFHREDCSYRKMRAMANYWKRISRCRP